MRRVLLSPHPDDAVWSCGGMLRRWAGHGELVVATVFDGGTPRRRDEDEAALSQWGLAPVSLRFTDAADRRDENGRPLYAGPLALRRAPHPADRVLVDRVADRLRDVIAGCNLLLLPLAERTHVDHRITRLAAEDAVGQAPPVIRYYREFPYAPPASPGYRSQEQDADFGAWLRGSLAYTSQVEAMFGTSAAFARRLREHSGPPGRSRWHYWEAVPTHAAT
ncbi:PIG-L family deacetylase [Micromonospora chokoriensis]